VSVALCRESQAEAVLVCAIILANVECGASCADKSQSLCVCAYTCLWLIWLATKDALHIVSKYCLLTIYWSILFAALFLCYHYIILYVFKFFLL